MDQSLQTNDKQASYVPATASEAVQLFDLAQREAKIWASCSIVPKAYQGNIPNCMVALDVARRLGASPVQVMQNLYVVHGTPSWSSTFLIAAVNHCGRYEERGDIGSEEQFAEVLDRIREQTTEAMASEQRAAEERREATRKAEEEARHLREVAEAQERRESELRAREEALRRSIEETRMSEAFAAGAIPAELPGDLVGLSDVEWAEIMHSVRDHARARKDAEAARVAAEEAARKEREERIAADAARQERERIEREAAEKAAAEEERLLRAGDVGQFEVMMQYLSAAPWPEKLRSAIARQSMGIARKHAAAALDVLNGALAKDLKG